MSTTKGSYITISREARPVAVSFNDTVIATTTDALLLKEGSAQPVIYVPMADVTAAVLEKTDRRTTCPHKGEASYWSISSGGAVAPNAVWGYETPKDGVKEIAGHVAFYPDKVRIEVG